MPVSELLSRPAGSLWGVDPRPGHRARGPATFRVGGAGGRVEQLLEPVRVAGPALLAPVPAPAGIGERVASALGLDGGLARWAVSGWGHPGGMAPGSRPGPT